MSHPDLVSAIVVGLLLMCVVGFMQLDKKLDRIIDLLIATNRQRGGDYDR